MSEDWAQYEKLVMSSLDRIEKKQEAMVQEIATLKAKATLWGSLAAFIVSVTVQIAVAVLR